MNHLIKKSAVFMVLFVLTGCANEVPMGGLGSSVALLRAEQTYNPQATKENAGYIPTGSGERMQSTLDVYHKQTASLKHDTSISADDVLLMPVDSSN